MVDRKAGDKSFEEGGEERSARVIRTKTGKIVTAQSTRHRLVKDGKGYDSDAIREGFGDQFHTNDGPVSLIDRDVSRVARLRREQMAEPMREAKAEYDTAHFLAQVERDRETEKREKRSYCHGVREREIRKQKLSIEHD